MAQEITLVALYDRDEDAQAALQELSGAGIDRSRMDIKRESSTGRERESAEAPASGGLIETLKSIFVPADDTDSYAEGVRRGGSLLWVRIIAPDEERVRVILDRHDPIDIDERGQQWRASGWAAPPSGSAQGTTGRAAREERVPVAEEELQVGKRDVSRGGVRVRSYVVEKPVEKEVRLRDEKVSVERRPASGRAEPGSGAFQEKTVEVSEVDEEPVVAKKARLKEEVVVRKDAQERTEKVADTVRETKVDVEKTGNPSRKRQPAGS